MKPEKELTYAEKEYKKMNEAKDGNFTLSINKGELEYLLLLITDAGLQTDYDDEQEICCRLVDKIEEAENC